MDREQSFSPPRCAAGCGFFGNPASENFCSKCFRERNAGKTAAPASPPPLTLASKPRLMSTSSSTNMLMADDDFDALDHELSDNDCETCDSHMAIEEQIKPKQPEPQQKKYVVNPKLDPASDHMVACSKPRDCDVLTLCEEITKNAGKCNVCAKKVGLLGFECRCKGVFCSKHRMAEDHECLFDHKGFDRALIRLNNPTVVAEKLNKI